MSKKKSVNIHYFRVVTLNGQTQFNLQDIAVKAHDQLGNLGERTIDRGGKRYSCLHCEKHKEGFLLNVSLCTPDELANTIPKPSTQSVAEPGLASAPQNTDFMDGDIHALIWDNHALICSVRIIPTILKIYLDEIFSSLNIKFPEYFFTPSAPTEALRALSEGIRRIDVLAAAQAAQLLQINDDKNKGFFHNLSLAASYAEKPLAAALEYKDTHAKVMLSIQQSGRLEQNTETQKELTKIAQTLINSEQETPYCIITKKNSRITSEMLQRKTTVRLEPNGKTVFRVDAWRSLVQQKISWKNEGVF